MEKLIEEGFFADKDLNCAETVLYGANEAHGWNLSPDALLLSSGFGGGVGGQELLCGALTGGVMALGKLFVRDRGHESDLIKTIVQDYFALFENEMGHIDCAPLKEAHRTEKEGCRKVILASARALDQIVEKYRSELAWPALRVPSHAESARTMTPVTAMRVPMSARGEGRSCS